MKKTMLILTLFVIVASASAATDVYLGMHRVNNLYTCELNGSSPATLTNVNYYIYALDVAGDYIYTASGNYSSNDGVYRYSLNGSNPTTLLSGGDYCNDSLCVTSNYIYYGEDDDQAIKRMDLDGGNVTTLTSFGAGSYIRAMRVSSNAIYYSSYGRYIYKCGLDGSNNEEILDVGALDACYGIAVDDQYLYFADSGDNTLNRCDLDGGNATVLLTDASAISDHATSLRLVDGRLYWSNRAGDATGNIIWSAAADGGESSATEQFNMLDVFGLDNNREVYFDIVVPEPTMMGLLAMGGIAFLRRKRR